MKCCCKQMSSGVLFASVIGAGIPIALAAREANRNGAAVVAFEDVISGDWSGFAESDDFPEDLPLSVTLSMDDENEVTGTFTTPDGDAPFNGFFDIETMTLTGAVTPEGASWELTLTYEDDVLSGDAEETFTGSSATVTLNRIEED